jgi:phage terminase large subunit GpA-like protein
VALPEIMKKSPAERYAAEVPSGVGVLVAPVDVQGDRLECAVKGYGAGEESWH